MNPINKLKDRYRVVLFVAIQLLIILYLYFYYEKIFIDQPKWIFSTSNSTMRLQIPLSPADRNNSSYLFNQKEWIIYNLDLNAFYKKKNDTSHGNELQRLKKLVLKRIEELQNPVADCSTKAQLVCELNVNYGFGSFLHHLMLCFTMAINLNRTLVFNENENAAYLSKGFYDYFQPISRKCVKINTDMESIINFKGLNISNPVKGIYDIAAFKHFSTFPTQIPEEFNELLRKIHREPQAWWAGLILPYLMRPCLSFQTEIQRIEKEIQFNGLCVGVHVRRSDKLTEEAAFHSIEEYMKCVIDYFDVISAMNLNSTNSSRVVYLASDEPSVFLEAKKKYPDYTFTHATVYELNNVTKNIEIKRQSIILDMYFLSRCEYLVVTFSSNVGRVAYELMQMKSLDFVDNSWRAVSLDDTFFIACMPWHKAVAKVDHQTTSQNEIELVKGDVLQYLIYWFDGNRNGYLNNGYLYMWSERLNKSGLVPFYKIKKIL